MGATRLRTEHAPDRCLRVEELRDWLPVDWHPDHFDLRQVNKALAALGPGEGDLVLATLPEPLRKLVERLPPDDRDQVDEWLGADPWTDALEPLPDAAVALTECFRVVLDVVGDGVTLTGAGYLPPGTVKEIFVRLGLDEESALVSLLAVAGGDGFHGGPGGRRAGTGRVATILTAAGWRSDRGDAVTAAQVRDVAAHTLATLEHMVRGVATDERAGPTRSGSRAPPSTGTPPTPDRMAPGWLPGTARVSCRTGPPGPGPPPPILPERPVDS